MERAMVICLFFIILLPLIISFFYSSLPFHQCFLSRHQVYIVHVAQPREGFLSANHLENWHKSFLPTTHLASGEPRLVYSYTDVIEGFAARLTAGEAKAMESKDGFLGAYLSEEYTPDTTYSPEFLDLHEGSGLWQTTNYGAGVIIGVIDTGINPNHVSFKDNDVPKPPEPKTKGRKRPCSFNPPFECNNKIIGAIGFYNGLEIPANDRNGHGTQCASIAAGNFVDGANVLGNANGRASGIAPRAHLMIYKACGASCNEHDILKVVELAVLDGVDVLTISYSNQNKDKRPPPFYEDGLAKASFRAIDKGIFVSMSASNSGPTKGSVMNTFPWALTVGASTIDRNLLATVTFKDVTFTGESANKIAEMLNYELVYPGQSGDPKAMTCEKDSFGRIVVRGKIVICHYGGSSTAIDKGVVVHKNRAAAMILVTSDERVFQKCAEPHVLPAVGFAYAESKQILSYAATKGAKADLRFDGDKCGTPVSPMVAGFSGRGPAEEDVGILKPDIVGPGVNILAASPFDVGPSPFDPPLKSDTAFTMVRGTSFSTPHLAGVAALLKASHSKQGWSPAMIKSAIMTSSSTKNHNKMKIVDEDGNAEADLFAMGAGHVVPMDADSPGLVYDINRDDYVNYLCGLPGYDPRRVKMVVGKTETCPQSTKLRAQDLNYPSIALYIGSGMRTKVTRTVKNVGSAVSKYELKISPVQGIGVTISPDSISFTGLDEEKSYSLEIVATAKKGTVVEAQLELSSESLIVRTPISVTVI